METSPLVSVAPTKSKQLDKTFHAIADVTPSFRHEATALIHFALPIIATLVLELLPGAFAVALVGHLDSPLRKEFVDAVALSNMFLNITGIAIGFGLSSAMDTLCSQTVGAGKLYNLGMYCQSGVLVLGGMFIPSVVLNYHSEYFLLLLHQDPAIAALSGTFSRVSVWCLPGLFLYELAQKVLQAQGIVAPMAYIAVVSNLVYGGLGYYLCYHTELGYLGAAYARAITNSLLPLLAIVYLWWNPVYKEWWPQDHCFSKQWKAALSHVPEFFALGVPGMLMMLIEWCAFEVCTVMAGWMPNPVLSISVQSVLLSLSTQLYAPFLGLGIATTVRVGNALGANEPNRAKMIASAALMLTGATCICMSIGVLLTHEQLALIFISDPASIAATQQALTWFCVFEVGDGMSCATHSLLKGMGKQSIGVWVNTFVFYVVGIPLGAALAFYGGMDIQGLWIGLSTGLLVGFSTYLWFICHVDWQQVAAEAVARSALTT
ncbi:Aste57867_2102 [Aphanomyces stellatus]|uniref:Aste57867_2102 protein n=1 Tax=Aphanomyces stellatus TaxID=120398 RepID=A0A485K9C6_9STRA|nr:hypothetical protein As57867_002097 [Aphanomyces stellatus]VFT79305.1 Aste57867_2102 [Aphanomyces stellatus]